MDITETYIKMADCEEIQGLWKPSEGDWVIERRYLGLPAYPSVLLGGLRDGTFIVAVGWEENDYLDEEGAIWLPTQSQLQKMVSRNEQENGTSLSMRLWEWIMNYDGSSPIYTSKHFELWSMEQLWLAFVMKEKYNKVWNGEEWIAGYNSYKKEAPIVF